MEKRHRRTLLLFDRILAHRTREQVLILMAVLFAAFVVAHILLAWVGADWIRFCESRHVSRWAAPFYLLIDGNAFNALYLDSDAEWNEWLVLTACVIYITGSIIFTGMIISVLTNIIERRVEDHRNGVIPYLLSGHYVIMGFDESVPSFVSHIFETDPKAFVCLLTSKKAIEARELLLRSLGEQRMKRVVINYGHRTSADAYPPIHLHRANEIYIVGYHHLPAHDAINIECVDSICRYFMSQDFRQLPKRITCVFRDLDTYAAFKTSEIFSKLNALNIEFVPYNFHTAWAKQVFLHREYRDHEHPQQTYPYPSIYGRGITPDDAKPVHLVFVGITNFSVAFAMEAAHLLHFPNYNEQRQVKTRITFIDVKADKEKDEFITRNRHFFAIQPYRYWDLSMGGASDSELRYEMIEYAENDFLDVEFEFIQGDIFSARVQREVCRWAQDRNGRYLSIFLALSDQRANFVMGMNMPDAVYEQEIPIFIRQDRSDNFVTNLREADRQKEFAYSAVEDEDLRTRKRHLRYANIYPFGMNESAYCSDEKHLRQAMLINYLYATADYPRYRFQGTLTLNTLPKEQIWKEAEKHWKGLTVALKWSNLYSAYCIQTKVATLRAMRGLGADDASRDTWPITDAEAEVLARVEHNRWNVEKLLMGFRKARPKEDKYTHRAYSSSLEKNKKVFIHHDIRPFGVLDEVRKLDFEFSRSIPWIIKMTESDSEA